MPRPEKGESQEDFISRAITEFRNEGFSEQEAIGRAYGFWRQYHKKSKYSPESRDYALHKEKHAGGKKR